jgi:hypothetical protein
MREAVVCLLSHLFGATLLAAASVGVLISGLLRTAILIFCLPSKWIQR